MNKQKLVEDLYKKISQKENFGVFGTISLAINPKNFKGNLSEKIEIKKRDFNPADNNKYAFFLHIGCSIPNIPDAIEFYFCGSECWIFTSFLATGNRGMEGHPFVLGWFHFLEKNGYEPERVGLDGSGNYTFLSIADAISLLNAWIDWMDEYSV